MCDFAVGGVSIPMMVARSIVVTGVVGMFVGFRVYEFLFRFSMLLTPTIKTISR